MEDPNADLLTGGGALDNTDRISDAEMDYHARIVERVRWAREAQQKIADIDAAFRSWGEHLHVKYELAEGEGVDENGVITRGAPTADSLDVAGR